MILFILIEPLGKKQSFPLCVPGQSLYSSSSFLVFSPSKPDPNYLFAVVHCTILGRQGGLLA